MSNFKPILLSLPSLTPSLAVEILPHGLTVHRIFVQADGRTHDLVIGPEAPEDHLGRKYINTVVGRYANRVPVGVHEIERKGVKGRVTALLNEGSSVSLHGGPVGFDSLPWTHLPSPGSSPPKSQLFTPTELTHLHSTSSALFRLISPANDQGYPGTLLVEALISLVAPGEQERHYREAGEPRKEVEYDLGSVVIVYRARLEGAGGGGLTPVNLTQHWGFNLDASIKKDQDPSVMNHKLTINSDRITKRDAQNLPSGEYISTSEDKAHAHDYKLISDKFPDAGYDDYYYFTTPSTTVPNRLPLTDITSANSDLDLLVDILKPSNQAAGEAQTQGRGKRGEAVVQLESEESGFKIVFDSNQKGVMFYTNNFADPSAARKKIHGGKGVKDVGDGYKPRSAAFLEFHDPLAAFLDPANKDGEDTLITSDEVYNNYVRMDVRYRERG